MTTIKQSLLAVLIVVAALSIATAQPAPKLDVQIQNANWIWLAGFEETPDAVVYFRRTFTLDSAPTEAVMHITCDNAYKVWINGTYAAETMTPGPEAWRVADAYDVTKLLKAGDNYIAVQGTNQGGKAALLMQIMSRASDGNVVTVSTDSTWEAASDPGENWQQPGSTGGTWQHCLDYGQAATTPPWFYPRPPSNLATAIKRAQAQLQSNIVDSATARLDTSATTAVVSGIGQAGEPVRGAAVSKVLIQAAEPGQKAVIICDFGKEVVGHPILIGMSYEGAKVTVTCGEYEAECDAPYQPAVTQSFERGAIRWLMPDRRAFRYAKFVVEPKTIARIDRLQAQLMEYSAERTGSFECSDDMLNRIWDVSARTDYLCMQDYYEDGIKRDRLLWIGDLRIEALVGYYTYGVTALPRRGLMQLADIQLPDGIIPGVGPAPNSTYLPDYCAYFVMSVADYYRFTGDKETVATLYPYVKKVMDWFKANTDDSGLFRHADRPGWWIFVDWDGSMEKKDRVTALEAVYYWALNDAAELARVADVKGDIPTYTNQARLLRQGINTTLWSAEQGAYVDCATDEGPSKLIHKQPNALAVLAGVPDTEMVGKAVDAILDSTKTPPVTTPYMNFYVASALFEQGKNKEAVDIIRAYWGGMIDRGATSFWEKFDPNWPTPYENAELSYCHGWSSGPGAMLPAYVAGIRPAGAGFQQAVVEPELAGLEWVKAEVPTSYGKFRVDWKSDRGTVVGTVSVPRDCGATLRLPQPPEGTFYTIDGKRARLRQDGGKLIADLKGSRDYVIGLQ